MRLSFSRWSHVAIDVVGFEGFTRADSPRVPLREVTEEQAGAPVSNRAPSGEKPAGDGVPQDMQIGGSPGDDQLYGGAGDDLIWGGRGDDRLDGGARDDMLIGGPGADDLIGGPGVDTADYSGANSRGVNISLGTGATWSDADGWPDDAMDDTFSSIENLVGTKFNDWLAADAGDNRLKGRRGNDWIVGGTDEDTLLGGESHDYLFGGRGDDVLYGGVGADDLFGEAGRRRAVRRRRPRLHRRRTRHRHGDLCRRGGWCERKPR